MQSASFNLILESFDILIMVNTAKVISLSTRMFARVKVLEMKTELVLSRQLNHARDDAFVTLLTVFDETKINNPITTNF